MVSIGSKFNKWTVLEEVEKTTARRFKCQCECGNISIVRIDGLTTGASKGCRNCAVKAKKHGDYKTRLYLIWMGIKNRCSFNHYYKDIKRCEEWDDYGVFKEWALTNGYKEDLEIDRKDPKGDYTPDNCRWVTQSVQARNTRLLSKSNTSGFRGVSFHKARNKWRVTIKVNNKQISIGSADSPEEAAKMYDSYVTNNNLEHPLNFSIKE